MSVRNRRVGRKSNQRSAIKLSVVVLLLMIFVLLFVFYFKYRINDTVKSKLTRDLIHQDKALNRPHFDDATLTQPQEQEDVDYSAGDKEYLNSLIKKK